MDEKTDPQQPWWVQRPAGSEQTVELGPFGGIPPEPEQREETSPPTWTAAPPPPTAAPPRRRGRSLLVPLLAALIGGAIGTGTTYVALDGNRAGTSGPTVTTPLVRATGGSLDAVAAVARAVTPSIVRIDTTGPGAFGEGTGSGVIYRSDGYILTNNHVVEGAADIVVVLSDGTRLPGDVVGTASPAVDVAVVKVNRTGLSAARLGSTTQLNVGDLAVAIGSPFGLSGTVTAGVISALHRNITLGPNIHFSDAIQTDAPINPGNSGGALVNGKGEVVGINTAIVGGAGGNVGVGFAIPIDIARQLADQIIETGRATLPFLGITGQNLPDDRGALVQDTEPSAPAARAGLQPGDIIVELDGQQVHSMDDLIALLIQKRVGQTVKIVYLRDGQRRTTQATLAARPGGA